MREILFRGKQKDNGKWIDGLLGYCNFNHGVEKAIYVATEMGSITPYRIKQETVGQYTGLTDKNGKKIFEGDIVKEKDCVHNGEVEIYGNKWVIYFKDGVFFGCWKNCGATFFIKSLGDIEIIGNIHDNPELLEVEE